MDLIPLFRRNAFSAPPERIRGEFRMDYLHQRPKLRLLIPEPLSDPDAGDIMRLHPEKLFRLGVHYQNLALWIVLQKRVGKIRQNGSSLFALFVENSDDARQLKITPPQHSEEKREQGSGDISRLEK